MERTQQLSHPLQKYCSPMRRPKRCIPSRLFASGRRHVAGASSPVTTAMSFHPLLPLPIKCVRRALAVCQQKPPFCSRRHLVDRVQHSGDPEAYLAISDAMGTMASGHEKIFGSNSGSEISTFAWQLAACRRGLDCSPTGSLMSMYCLHGGICGNFSSFEDLVFRGLAPESDKTRINAMVNRITSRGDVL